MRATLLNPHGEQAKGCPTFGALVQPNHIDPFTKLAEFLRQLPEEISNRLLPLTVQFRVKKVDTALRKASTLVHDVARRAPVQLELGEASGVLASVADLQKNIQTATEFATRIVRNDFSGASPLLTRSALEHLLDTIPEGVAHLVTVAKELSAPRRSPSSVRDVMERIRAAGSPDRTDSLTVLGEEVVSVARPTHMELERVALHRPSEGTKTVAHVVSARENVALDKLLLITSAAFVGKDGEVYHLRIPGHVKEVAATEEPPPDFILAYDHTGGRVSVGAVPKFAIAGVRNSHGSNATVTMSPLAGAQVAASVDGSTPLEVCYREHGAVEQIGSSLVSEILELSGARTALPPFLAQVIERSRGLPPGDRVHVLCSAFFARDYVYSKDDSLHQLIERVPRPVRFSFLAGLRIGNCETMSCELQNLLAIAGIPAVVEGGALYDPERRAFCTPGHARVRCLTDPQLVIDPTCWSKSRFDVAPPSAALGQEILSALSGKEPVEAFALAETLRNELLYEPELTETDALRATRTEDLGHGLSDDFERRSLLAYKWDIQMEASQLHVWSELIKEEVRDGGDPFFSKFHCSDELNEFLKQANDSVIAGTSTLFTDWVQAYLRHPRKEIARCVSFPLFCTFDPNYHHSVSHQDGWATLLWLADHLDPVAHRGSGDGPLGGDYVRQFMMAFVRSYQVETKIRHVEELFVGVAVRTLNDWVAELREPDASKDEEAFACFASRLVELCPNCTPKTAALLKTTVADALRASGESVVLAFIAGLRGNLEEDSVELLLASGSQAVKTFVRDYLPEFAASSDLAVRAFERCKAFLDSDFRVHAGEAVETELGKSGIKLYPWCRGSSDAHHFARPEDRCTVGPFSFWLGYDQRQFTKEEFIEFSQTEKFKDAVLDALALPLDRLLGRLYDLADNIPEPRRHTLLPLYSRFIQELLEEFSITLPERSEIVRARDRMFEGLFHCLVDDTFTAPRQVALQWARLTKAGLLPTDLLSSYTHNVHDSKIAADVCRFLDEQALPFQSPNNGLLMNIATQYASRRPVRWSPLVLLSLQSETSWLPPILADAVRATSSFAVSEGDRALWAAVMTHRADEYRKILGSLTESLAPSFFSNLIVTALDRNRCDKILTSAFLAALEGQQTDPHRQHNHERIEQAVRQFLPEIESAADVTAISKFLSAVAGVDAEEHPCVPAVNVTNPFADVSLRNRLKALRASSSAPTRALLWKLEPARDEPDEDTPLDARPLSRNLWRNTVSNMTGRHQRATIRSLLGTPDPYDIRHLSQYVPGDDIRHIDWKASGRIDRLCVKKLERATPVDARRIVVCVDRSDMGYVNDRGAGVVNDVFIDHVVGFLCSMIVDGKQPSLTLFSYGVPDAVLDCAQVQSLFFDNNGASGRRMLLKDARQASESAYAFKFPETVVRAGPTIHREAEAHILEGTRDSLLLMVTAPRGDLPSSRCPTTPIWLDPFSRRLVEQGHAVRVELE